MRKSICLISFSSVARDGRVLRQIRYLSQHYDLTVIGYGEPHPSWKDLPNVKWKSVPQAKPPAPLVFSLMLLGKLWPPAYDIWYWSKLQHVRAFDEIAHKQFDAFYANEWDALPLAVKASRKNHAKVIYDAHEYNLGEIENVGSLKRWLMPPALKYLLKKSRPYIGASITVAPKIAQKYSEEFDLNPIVVLNAPEKIAITYKEVDPESIHLVHHGHAQRNRRLETMIETIALSDRRYILHFMLIEFDAGYIGQLKSLAAKLAPGRIFFENAVDPGDVVQRISTYDVGFYPLKPSNYNNLVALPNKFFDFIVAGLAVCIGPSPSMAEIVRQYGLGCVAPSFVPEDIAKALNQISVEQWMDMRKASRKAAKVYNAENELKKLIKLVNQTLMSD